MKILISLSFVVLSAAATCAQDGLTVEVTAIKANIRQSPSAKARIVKVVPRNTELPVYAYERNRGWLLVRLGENWGGWIKATLVRERKKPNAQRLDG